MAQDNIKALYGALKDTYELGSEDDFRKYLSNGTNREALRKELESEYEVGDSASFSKYLGFDKPAAQPTGQAAVAQQPTQPQNPQQPVSSPAPTQMPQGFGQMDFRQANQMGLGKGPVSWEQPSAEEPQEETFKDKVRRIGKGQLTQEETKRAQSRIRQRQDEITYEQETGKRLRQPVLNPEWEAPTVVKDEYGNIRRDEKGNPLIGITTDQDRAAEHQQIVSEQEAFDAQAHSVEEAEEQARARLQEVNKKLDPIERERMQQYVQQEYDKGILGHLAEALMRSANTYGMNTPYDQYRTFRQINQTNKEASLQARKRLLEYGLQLADDARKDAEMAADDRGWLGNIVQGLGRAYGKAVDVASDLSTWDFGAGDMEKQAALFRAVVRDDNGVATEDDKKLLDDFALSQVIESGAELSNWTKAGLVTGESLPFMLEMLATRGGALGTKMGEQYMKYAVKKYGANYVRHHMKSVLARKIAAKVVGDLVASHAMAGTTGIMRTTANAYERMRGDINTGVDENGRIIYDGHEVGDSAFDAFSKAWRSTAIENWSEMAGEYLPVMTGFFGKAVGKAVVGKAGREALRLTGNLENVSLNKAQRFIYDLVANKGIGAFNKGLGEFMKRTQWHGTIGEYAEEVLGNLANAITIGDMTLDTEGTGVFNLQQNIDTFNGVALMGGFMSALHTGGFGIDKYRNSVSRRMKQGAEALGDNWERVKASIDSSVDDPSELNNTLTDLIRDGGTTFGTEQKKAIMNYVSAVMQEKGAEMVNYKPRMASSTSQMVIGIGEDGKLATQYAVTSYDKNGEVIEQQTFKTRDEAEAYRGELKMQQQNQDFKDYLSMVGKLSYGESSSAVDEFLKANGYDEADDLRKSVMMAAINVPTTEFGKRFREYKTDKAMQKARASMDAIAEFEAQNGWTPGTVQWLTEQDPMQLDDAGLQMADQAREFLKGLAYPNTEVHTDISAQEGTEAAEGVVNQMANEPETVNPADNAGQQITKDYVAAKTAREQLFGRNEEIAQEVTLMEVQGYSPQEILSSLDTFSEADRQILTDWYNQQARFDSYMMQAEQKINEAANMNRQRRTFTGTINGQPDNANLIYITDGQNTHTLVSGNVRTNSQTGQIMGSDSGLVIALDENGDFIQLPDASTYSVVPSGITLDQYEAGEVQRLQEAVTQVTDPNGALQQEQQANETFPGGEQDNPNEGTNGFQGGDNQVDNTSTNTETPQVEAQAVAPAEIPVDKDGVKRYEQGVPIDQAIDDMKADKVDPNSEADLAINEAQTELSKMKEPKTRAERVKNDKRREELQDIIDYYTQLKQRYVERNREENVNNEPKQPQSEGNVVPSQPKLTVEEQKQERIKALKAELGEFFDDDFTKANDVYELVSMWLSRERKLDRDSVGQELGWNMGIGKDARYIETMLAKKGEGVKLNDFIHMVWESPENDVMGEKRYTTEEIREALLELFRSAKSKSDVVDYAVNEREKQARAALAEQQQRQAEEAESGETGIILTDEDLARIDAGRPFEPMTDEETANDPFLQNFDEEGNYIYKFENDEYNNRSQGLDGEPKSGGTEIGSQESLRSSEGEESSSLENLRGLEEGGVEQDGTDQLADVLQSPESVSVRTRTDSETGSDNQEKSRGETAEYVPSGAIRSNELNREDGGRGQGAGGTGLSDSRGRAEADGLQSGGNQGASESQDRRTEGSQEQAVDDYLQPRDAEEEKIVADVLAQLQQEIQGAIDEQNKARSELQRAQARESERATDLFGNDNALNQPGQLFDNSDMPVDQSVEGVERRTEAERQRLQEATNKLNQMQSLEERNSRIRGALDNHRRQTSIEGDKLTPEERLKHERFQLEDDKSKRDAQAKIVEDLEASLKTANDDEREQKEKRLQKAKENLNFFNERVARREKRVADAEAKLRKSKTDNPIASIMPLINRPATSKEIEEAMESNLVKSWLKGKGNDQAFNLFSVAADIIRYMAKARLGISNKYEVGGTFNNAAEVIEGIINSAKEKGLDTAIADKYDFHDGDTMQKIINSGEPMYTDAEVEAISALIPDGANKSLLGAMRAFAEEKSIRQEMERIKNYENGDAVTKALALYHIAKKRLNEQFEGDERFYRPYTYVHSSDPKRNGTNGRYDPDFQPQEGETVETRYNLKGSVARDLAKIIATTPISERSQSSIKQIADPIEAIEQAAQQFRQEQEEAEAKIREIAQRGKKPKSNNKIFTDKAHEEVLKKLRSKFNNLNAGFDPEIALLMLQDAGYHIEKGARRIAECAKAMIDELGDFVRPYIKSAYNAVRDYPGMEEIAKEMSSFEEVQAFDPLNYDKQVEQTVNEHKQKNNEPEKPVSLQGDSVEFLHREVKMQELGEAINDALFNAVMNDDIKLKTMQGVRALAKEYGLEDMSQTDLQELVEAEIVNVARDIASTEAFNDEQKFDYIKRLYELQPTLSARDNDRINKQQYSTPAPMAFLMGKFAGTALTKQHTGQRGLEPSAGNGMLTIALPKEVMHVNDIDEMRLSNLQKQGFGQVTSQDGLQPFGDKQYDVVVTNPPFGNVPAKTYDGLYEISGLEHQMAINALESMKDDGRAAIIIGGNTEYNQNGTIKGKDRAFLNYLYAHYNVVDVINMNGHELYSRQGTGFPVRMILINGRKEFNPRNFAPVIQKARAERVNSYDELYKRVNDDILSDENKPAGVHDTESGESRRVDDNSNAGASTQTGVRNVRPEGSSGEYQLLDNGRQHVQGRSGSTREGTNTEGHPVVDGTDNVVHGTGSETSQSGGATTSQTDGRGRVSDGRNSSERPNGGVDEPVGGGSRTSVEVRRLGTEKVPYRQQSKNPYSLQSQMPAEQAETVKKSLEELGDVDEFLVRELGYSSVEDLHHGSQSPENHGGLAAEQVDSVAMAIHQMNQGNAFIIGDQTGIGKGRQAAALIRYGVKKGGCPVFISVKKGLFSDMYRDLCDIGSPELRPFIWSADDDEHSADITDKNGNVVYKRPSDKEQKRVVEYINKHGKLPPEYDYIVTTYDSFKGGTMTYENGKKEPRKFAKGKSATSGAINSQSKRDALERLAENSYVIMDESHNAGGETSAVSGYLQYITTRAKGVTFLSATFAKRPGNMPIYSLKTAISKAGVKVEELIDAVKRGGATFQEIMSKALTEAGQMIRRERDMTGVTIDWRGIEDEAIVQKQREQYDTVIGLFNDIIQFQRAYVDPIVNGMNDAAAEEQGEVDHTPGTRDMGINNTPFASRTYNMVQQVLLSLKAEEAAKRAIEHLKAGRKPVITVANTNEGAADEAAGMGDSMEMPDLSVNLKKGLQGTMRITKKDAFGNTTAEMIPFERLSEEGRKRYQEIMDAIENASSGLSLSPIDVIKNILQKAGYKVGELTGRKAEFVYNEDGTVRRVKRQDTDKKRIAADFNNGKLDALILNRSAGTGISLHASSKFDDQRQRIMIVAQAQGDVNDEVQIRGRIDRTGQVLRGMYEYVVSQIPSEQRLLMMLKAKLRSLDANTTSSQKSKFNEMQVQDIINKYGDEVVIGYLAEHPDLAMKMCDPLKWGEGAEILAPETLISQAQKPSNGGDGATASKVLGRMALLTVKEQEKMLAEIGDLYSAEIDRLNEMGENDLEITEMPLKAKTLRKDVWEEGVEPGGKNPFADNSYVETVEMDVLKKPMKAEEVKKSQERLLGGKTWEEYKQETLSKVEDWAANKKEETRKTITERAEKKATAEKEKYIKGAKKAQEKNGFTDEQIEKFGQMQYDTFFNQEMEKLNNALEAVDKQAQAFVDALETFSTDGVYALPTDIYDLSQLTFEPSFGKVIDINVKEDNYSTAASTITFATLDGRRKITIPISGMVKQHNGEKRDIKPTIVQQTAQSRDGFFGRNIADTYKVLSQNIDNWDRLISTATRKKGYIITGNLLKALTELRKQGKGGKLISYTTDTGDVRQGILMSDQFDPKTLTSKNPISSAKADLNDWSKDRKIVSVDKEVEVRNDGGGWYQLKVPKSKKKGEKYFNDKTLLDLVSGQFEGSSRMAADFRENNLDAILKRLDELGVTVESTKEEQNDMNSGYSEDLEDNINETDTAFSNQLDAFQEGKMKSSDTFSLGRPSPILRASGIKAKKLILTQSVLKEHLKRHGLSIDDIRDLPSALAQPMMVYEWGDKAKSHVIITNLTTKDGRKITVTLRVNSDNVVTEVSKITSVHGKDAARLISEMNTKKTDFSKDNLKYVDKEKALDWLAMDSPLESRQDNAGLDSAAKIIKDFENPSISDEFNTNSEEMNQGYSEETDEEVIERLEKEPKVKVYRAMSLIDGKLYPPMATKQDGSLVNPIELGKWEKSDEHPEKAVLRNGKWVFKLTKDNGKSLFAAYNPYIHTSTTMLNDQFSEAQSRPNLVVVEVEVPESELTSGYKAEKAKDAVGKLEWKAGIIQGQLTGTREVILSRWDKPVRIVPTEEVAKHIAEQIKGKVEVMPTNVVTPQQREALEKEGVKFVETDNQGKITEGPNKGKTYSSVYGKKTKGTGYSEGEADETRQHTQHKEKIRKHVENLLKKLGTRNRTTVITSINGVRNKARRQHIEDMHKRGKKVYGWFENGRIYLYLPDIDSIYKAEQTIWHETVAHVGLRELLGTENYGKLLNRLWMEHKDGEMGQWVTRRMQTNGWSLHKAIDEWLAREAEKVVAERQERKTLWQKLAGWVGDILRELGYRTNPTVTDVRYLFWLSENQLREGEPMSAIKQANFLYRLENEVAVTQQQTEREEMRSGFSEDIDEEPHKDDSLQRRSAKQKYELDLSMAGYVVEEAYRDSMLALKKAQYAIGGENIPDSQNAYMAENQMHSKNKIEQDRYMHFVIEPLVDTINQIMARTGMDQTEIERYIYTKSALERNRQFYVRDFIDKRRRSGVEKTPLNDFESDIYDMLASRIEEDFDDGIIDEPTKERKLAAAPMQARQMWLDKLEDDFDTVKQEEYMRLREGDITFADYLGTLDAFIVDNIGDFNPSENDYSGLTDMYGDEEGKYDDAYIVAEVMDSEDMINGDDGSDEMVERLWGQLNDATQFGLDREHEAGLISDESYKRATKMFHWYVPLRGFSEATAEDMYQYLTGKGKVGDYVGKTLKHAKGRKSEAKHPISTIFTMANNSIVRSNRNLVKQKFYRLVNANENDLVVIKQVWAVQNEDGEWVMAYPDITDGMNDRQIRAEIDAFEERMREKEEKGEAVVMNGKANIPYRVLTPEQKSEHIIEVSLNGQRKMMIVNGNPRLAQALNGLTNFERGKNIISKLNGTIKNWMASVFTNYSITFGMRNMMRDWTHFRVSLHVREGEAYAHQAAKYYREALPKMRSLFKKYRENALDMNNPMERDFKDFMDNGGVTGYVQMKKVDEWQEEMDAIIKKMNAGKVIKFNNQVWDKILGAVEGFNEAIENTARFATYRTSRNFEHRTKARSAYDAKEVTVNFNRKGAGYKTAGFKGGNEEVTRMAGMSAQVIGEGRLFFNATIQAIANVFKGFRNPDGSLNKKFVGRWAARFAAPPFFMGLVLPFINQMMFQMLGGGDGDDPYANLAEWTRRKNICIWIGGNNFLTIPIGQELAAFMSLGDIIAGLTYKPDLKPVDRTMDEEIMDVLSTFSPIDLGTKLTDSESFWTKRALDATRPFSVAAPIIAIGTNYGWTGRPIYRTEWGGKNLDPEYQKVYSGTNPLLVQASKALHELGGGDDVSRGNGMTEINPAVIQYLWEQYTGGPGKFMSNTISIGKDVANWDDNDFNIRKVEGLKAFVQQGDDRTKMYRTQAKYFKYKKDLEKLKHDVSGYRKLAGESPELKMKLEQVSKSPDFVRMQILNQADKQLQTMRKAANQATGKKRRELNALYDEQLKRVVDKLDSVGQE